jgi:hypothetical protein
VNPLTDLWIPRFDSLFVLWEHHIIEPSGWHAVLYQMVDRFKPLTTAKLRERGQR